MDRQGHVNNAVFSTYLETGRVGVIYRAEDGLMVPGATTVMTAPALRLCGPSQPDPGTAAAKTR